MGVVNHLSVSSVSSRQRLGRQPRDGDGPVQGTVDIRLKANLPLRALEKLRQLPGEKHAGEATDINLDPDDAAAYG